MKVTLKFNLLSIIFIVLLFSCKGKKNTSTENLQEETVNTIKAVCIWDKVSVREIPSKDGKWLTSLSLGEKCTYLNEEKEEIDGNRIYKYLKIELQDGKQGWVQSDFIVIDGVPGVVINDAPVYNRPDLLTKTDKFFSKFDIVGVSSSQNDFYEVKGKRKNGKWIEIGWVKKSNISLSDSDIALAKYAAKALSIEDPVKRKEAIKEILNNPDFTYSIFLEDLRKELVGESTEEVSVAAE